MGMSTVLRRDLMLFMEKRLLMILQLKIPDTPKVQCKVSRIKFNPKRLLNRKHNKSKSSKKWIMVKKKNMMRIRLK
jgi:hypothetical protein